MTGEPATSCMPSPPSFTLGRFWRFSSKTANANFNAKLYWSEDVLLVMLPHLTFQEVCKLERTCTMLRDCLRQPWVWRKLLQWDFPQVMKHVACADFDDWRTLYACLVGSPQLNTILQEATCASSTDQPRERPSNTLASSLCTDKSKQMQCSCSSMWRPAPCYWSSRGSSDPASVDWIRYSTVGAPCLVVAIEFSAYRAFWQPSTFSQVHGRTKPTYAPKRVRAVATRGEDVDASEVELGVWDVPLDMAAHAFRWELPEPMFVSEGFIRIEFLGKHQRQTLHEQNDYFVCVNYVRVEGILLNPCTCGEFDPWGQMLGRERAFTRQKSAGSLEAVKAPCFSSSSIRKKCTCKVGSFNRNPALNSNKSRRVHKRVARSVRESCKRCTSELRRVNQQEPS